MEKLIDDKGRVRCINLDWLEVFCIEDEIGYPHNAEYFQQQGFIVNIREYGTRIYKEMFTICDNDGLPFAEIRRYPCANDFPTASQILPHNAAHVRFVNRSCYIDRAAELMQTFCEQYGYAVQRISRIDIALDFVKFDQGDEPQRFIERYMKGRYAKVNQSRIRGYGTDEWDGRRWNSLAWGSPTSQVSTKLYCKSQELREAKDKPYIRQAWALCSLIDDMHTMTKTSPDGTRSEVDVWRLEFSIKSGVRNWFVIDVDKDGRKTKQSVRNTLDMYVTRRQLLDVFSSLADHYFHFKKYETDKVKYKCEDKVLFLWSSRDRFYDVIRPANSTPMKTELERLRVRLERLYTTTFNADVQQAILTVLNFLQERLLSDTAARRYDKAELLLLRTLIHFRLSSVRDETVQESINRVSQLLINYNDAY